MSKVIARAPCSSARCTCCAPARSGARPAPHRAPGRGLWRWLFCATLAGCSGSAVNTRPDGLDPETLPVALRDDYEVFAQRCSRCHSLSRPLSAGFNDMDHWRNYVARMRRQPSSGISPADEGRILAFLEYYTAQRRARSSGDEGGAQ